MLNSAIALVFPAIEVQTVGHVNSLGHVGHLLRETGVYNRKLD
jgi:hypothetical protein